MPLNHPSGIHSCDRILESGTRESNPAPKLPKPCDDPASSSLLNSFVEIYTSEVIRMRAWIATISSVARKIIQKLSCFLFSHTVLIFEMIDRRKFFVNSFNTIFVVAVIVDIENVQNPNFSHLHFLIYEMERHTGIEPVWTIRLLIGSQVLYHWANAAYSVYLSGQKRNWLNRWSFTRLTPQPGAVLSCESPDFHLYTTVKFLRLTGSSPCSS